ncbi:MAG: D-sedoheptulose-7-phosphate isomerase, partial [Candidatus Binatia bacterium]
MPSGTESDIRQLFQESLAAKRRFLEENVSGLARVVDLVAERLLAGNKILLFGNGGSAADAQHIAAELVGRFERERRPLPAIALTTDRSIVTSIGNDYGYEHVFSRQVRALGRRGD